MLLYILKRLLYVIPLIFFTSIVVFIIIQLPPGDFLSSYIMKMEMSGTKVEQVQIQMLKNQYGLDKSAMEQYVIWVKKIVTKFDFGASFQYNRPVAELIGERLPTTIMLNAFITLLSLVIAVPLGVYSAVHKYQVSDYTMSALVFIFVAIPGFLLALILMYLAFVWFGISAVGLFSPKYEDAAWSVNRLIDLLKHIWIPAFIIGMAGTAGTMRTMRGMVLDEYKMQYVITARAKGLSERKLLWKYPVRVALNPIVSSIGGMLAAFVSGETLVSTVLNIPTLGSLLYRSLLNQDMYLAGSIILMMSLMIIIGTLISDIILVFFDPRIKFDEVSS